MSESQACCAMCSVECPVAVQETAAGRRWEPLYPPRSDGLRGLCARGNLLGELAGLPQRLRRAATGRGAERRWCAPAAAVGKLADALKQAAKPAILVDGRLPWEDLASLAGVARAMPAATFCVYAPPEESQLVAGLAAAGVTPARPAAMCEADGFLLIGDVFAAAPVAAGPVLAVKTANPRVPIIQIDVTDSITGRFASHALQIAAGGEHWAAAALAVAAGATRRAPLGKLLPTVKPEELAAACGLEPAAVAAAAEALGGAKKIAVAIAPCPGRTARWDVLALAAALIAGKAGCVVPATSYRAHAFLAAAALQSAPLNAALDGSHDLLLVVGCDPAAGVPNLWGKAAASATVAAMLAVPGAISDAAAILLPIPTAEESAGTLLQWDGGLKSVSAVLDPPAGAALARELAADIAGALGVPAAAAAPPKDASVPAPETLEPVETPAAAPGAGDRLILAMRPDASAFGDGAITGLTGWSQATRPAPVIQLAAADADRLGLADGDIAEVRSDHGSCAAGVAVEPRLRAGQATINAAFAASRGLFDFRPVAACAAVTVEKKDGV